MAQVTNLPTYPTVAEELAAIQAALQNLPTLLTNYNPGGATETYLEALAILAGSDASTVTNGLVTGIGEYLTEIQNAEFISTASGKFLDLKAADVGVFRKSAVAATGYVVFDIPAAISTDTPIPINTLVGQEQADPTLTPVTYSTQAAGDIPAGSTQSAPVPVTAVLSGSSGNAEPNLVTLVLNLAGVSVTNSNSIGGGQDQEQDDSPNGGLRARALAAIPNAAQCTIGGIENEALSYAGITSAVLLDNTAEDGVTFLRGESQLYCDDGSGDLANPSNPNNAVLTQLQNDLTVGKYRAAGTQVYVHGSIIFGITVSLSVQVSANYVATTASLATVQSNVQTAVYNLVQATQIAGPVLVSEIIAAAAGVAGVVNITASSVLINGNNADIGTPTSTPLAANQTPRCADGISDVTVTATTVTYA